MEEIDHFAPRATIACYGFGTESEKEQAIAEAKKYVTDNDYTSDDVKIVIDGGDCVLVVTKRKIMFDKSLNAD